MAWGNEKHMRPYIAARREANATMRQIGRTWASIARALGYGSPQHARLDWLRGNVARCAK